NLVIEAVSSNNNIVDLGNAIATDEVEVASITNDAPAVFPLGDTVVTWTATDSSGNLVNATQTITVVDTTAPTIETLPLITVEATSLAANPVLLATPKAQDSVSNVIITNDAPDVFQFGETIVTWQAIDEAGNFVTTTQNVSVIDTTSPTLTVPANITVDAISIATPISIGEASATDVTDSLPAITNDAPFAFILGENIVTWTSIDKLGNSVSMTQKVTVQACGKPHSYYNMIFGTEEDDMVTGTNLSDLVFALGGDDIVFGEKGNDCILGGEGDDIIYGNEGNDNISSGEGTDIIKGLSGDDILNGGSGIDVIDGGDDVDSCNVNDQSKEDLIVKCES
ncbi:MAG: hypothetical protein AABW55_04585, partial [Thermoproteota archaeon]